MKLVKKTEVPKPEVVYNLHIKHDHNYVVQGAVVSNCHGVKGAVLKEMLGNIMSKVPIRWGFTGTIPPNKHDESILTTSIGPIVGALKAHELQERGVLSNCQINILQLDDKTQFTNYQAELKYLTTDHARLAFIAKLSEEIAKTGNTLILVDRISAGKELQTLLSSALSLIAGAPEVDFISGETDLESRKEAYEKMTEGQNICAIATFGVAAVGINIPRIFNVILLEPGKSFVRVIQSIGRGIRKAHDKDFVNVWDISSTCKFSARHMRERIKFYEDAKYPYHKDRIKYK